MQVSRRKISQTILFIVIITSAISFVVTTINYVDLCSALANFQLRVEEVDFVLNNGNIDLTINFTISNPTRYGGFELRGVYTTLYYEGEPHNISSGGGPRGGSPFEVIETRWWQLQPNEDDFSRRVLPYSEISIPMIFRVTGKDAELFTAFLEKQGQQKNIQWKLDTKVILETPTFLGTTSLEFPDIYYP